MLFFLTDITTDVVLQNCHFFECAVKNSSLKYTKNKYENGTPAFFTYLDDLNEYSIL